MRAIRIKDQNILLMADTHGKHRLLKISEDIQIVIHCGDICNYGKMSEIMDFFEWYSQLQIPHKIFIHGNHDLPFELEPEASKSIIPKNIVWLNNEITIIQGIKILGINAFPYFDVIPKTIDIIASHYPPQGILDHGYGTREIAEFIIKHKPLYHVFGHNHSGFGMEKSNNIHYINATSYQSLCQNMNP